MFRYPGWGREPRAVRFSAGPTKSCWYCGLMSVWTTEVSKVP